MSKYEYHQREKLRTLNFHFIEAEDPRKSVIAIKSSKDKSLGMIVISEGKSIKKLRDWLNQLPLEVYE